MFKSKFTKWIPFGNYCFSDTDYIVFVRKNLNNGLLQFKTVTVHAKFRFHSRFVPTGIIDTKTAWENIINQ